MTYIVTLQAADGRQLDQRVQANSERIAENVVWRLIHPSHRNGKGDGWRILRTLPATR